MIDIIAQSPFAEIAALLVLAAVTGFVGIILRQPLIVSFIAVGLIAGPSALDLVRSDAQIGLLSQLGIAVLLFLVGIKLDVKLIRSLGAVSLLTGLGQVGLHVDFRLPDRACAWVGAYHQLVCRHCADILVHHHHRETAVRQA